LGQSHFVQSACYRYNLVFLSGEKMVFKAEDESRFFSQGSKIIMACFFVGITMFSNVFCMNEMDEEENIDNLFTQEQIQKIGQSFNKINHKNMNEEVDEYVDEEVKNEKNLNKSIYPKQAENIFKKYFTKKNIAMVGFFGLATAAFFHCANIYGYVYFESIRNWICQYLKDQWKLDVC
jgi:hypothetical protein